MTTWIVLSGIIAPALFWTGYFYYKDRFFPEPVINIAITYFLGFLSGFICLKIYGLLPQIGITADPSFLMENNRWQFLGYCLGIVGFLEEIFKFIPFLFIIFFFKAFDEKIDGIIYASTVALGFASFENINYLPSMEGVELFGRAAASPLIHTIFASIWGYHVGKARLFGKSILKPSLISIFLASISHGFFDFLTLSSSLRILSAVFILSIWIWRIKIIERLNQEGRV